VTVDPRGAMRSYATRVCVTTSYLDEATGRRHDGLMATPPTSVSLDPRLVRTHVPVGDHTVAMGEMPATGTSRSVATGQPSLITNRCHKEYS
jgi:hypothetical protein